MSTKILGFPLANAPEELPRNVFDLGWPELLAMFQVRGTAKARECAMNVMRLDLAKAQTLQRVYYSESGDCGDRITTPLLSKWTNGTVDAVLDEIKSSLPDGSKASVVVTFDRSSQRDLVTVGNQTRRWWYVEDRSGLESRFLPARVRAYLYSKSSSAVGCRAGRSPIRRSAGAAARAIVSEGQR